MPVQTPAVMMYGEQDPIRVVAPADVKAGTMFHLGARRLPVISAVAAGQLVALDTAATWQIPKTAAGVFAAGDAVAWSDAGNPAVGDPASGAAVASAAGLPVLGFCVEPAGATDHYVETKLSIAAASIPGTA